MILRGFAGFSLRLTLWCYNDHCLDCIFFLFTIVLSVLHVTNGCVMGSVFDWSGIRKIYISNNIQCKCVFSGCTNFKYFDFSTLDLYIWSLP